MKPSRPWLYYLITLASLAAYLWTFQFQDRLARLPSTVDSQLLAWPVTVGPASAATPAELAFAVERFPVGHELVLPSATGPRTVRLVRAFATFHDIITLFCALVFWIACLLVFVPRIERPIVRDFYWATLLYGLAMTTGGIHPPVNAHWSALLPSLGRIACMALIPAFFVHMTLVFPRRYEWLDRRTWVLPGIFGVASLIVALTSLTYVGYVMAPTAAGFHGLTVARRLADLWLLLAVGCGAVFFYRNSRRAELAREREQVKSIWWGVTVGAWPFLSLFVLPGLLGFEPILPIHLLRLFTVAIPLSFALVVVRLQFLDIDVIIRRSLIYGLLAGVLMLGYVAAAAMVGRRVGELFPATAGWISFLTAAVPVILFDPTRRAIGSWVDRAVFKIRYLHEVALADFRRRLPGAASQPELARHLLSFAELCLHPRLVGVTLASGEWLLSPAGAGGLQPGALLEPYRQMTHGRAQVLARAGATGRPELEREEWPPAWSNGGVVLVQPIGEDNHLHGLLLLGEKESERRYIDEDLRLLRDVAHEAAVSLERMILVQEAAHESLERQRLDELNRQKSDFMSRVAHDLRTPVTSIGWSADNLLDGIVGSLTPRQVEYMTAIRSSTRQLGRLVNNLLDLSRLEAGQPRVTIGPVDLAGVVDEAVASLHPMAESLGVRFDVSRAAALPAVRADREKVLEIVLNLLENALRYSPSCSAIELKLAVGESPGEVLLTVRDHGPGIPEVDRERIFERFAQGPPSPFGRPPGLGLGLHVVRAYMELFGGAVVARNHPDGGAALHCRWPVWSPEEVHAS